MLKRSHRTLLGLTFWAGLLVTTAVLGGRATEDSPGAVATAGRVLDYSLGSVGLGELRHLDLALPTQSARYGDPIFTRLADGEWIQAGYLEDVVNDEPLGAGSTARAAWYTPRAKPEGCSFVFYENRGSLADVVQTLLPPAKRERLVAVLREALAEHGAAIQGALKPIVERSLRETAPVIEAALMDSIASHRPQLEALGVRYEETFLRQRLIPMLRQEVLPVVREHGSPVARSIGEELWQRASVWRFGWRALYDSTPLPERDLVGSEFDRYLRDEASPVVEAHMEDLVDALKRIALDVAQNPAVRGELEHVAGEVAKDPEVRALLGSVLRESVVENEELKAVWVRNWKAEEARRAVSMAGARLDPVVRRLGDELFGTKETGIHPDFARVLRNQILGKDRRWIVAMPSAESGAPPILKEPILTTRATERGSYPLVIMASPQVAAEPQTP